MEPTQHSLLCPSLFAKWPAVSVVLVCALGEQGKSFIVLIHFVGLASEKCLVACSPIWVRIISDLYLLLLTQCSGFILKILLAEVEGKTALFLQHSITVSSSSSPSILGLL